MLFHSLAFRSCWRPIFLSLLWLRLLNVSDIISGLQVVLLYSGKVYSILWIILSLTDSCPMWGWYSCMYDISPLLSFVQTLRGLAVLDSFFEFYRRHLWSVASPIWALMVGRFCQPQMWVSRILPISQLVVVRFCCHRQVTSLPCMQEWLSMVSWSSSP